MLSPKDLLALAEEAARRAARFLRSVGRPDPRDWAAKGRHDFVTEVDREAERVIRAALEETGPAAAFLGEELSPDQAVPTGLLWIVDPLDGTTNFLHGYPAYAVSIAAAVDGELVAGCVLDVTRDALSSASRGGGAWRGSERLRVSTIADPGQALVGTGFPFKHLDRLEEYQAQLGRILRGSSGVRRAGSAALDLADVAAGRFDGFWELHLAPWDIAAGLVLVREAGGCVTDLEGRGVGIGASAVVAGNPAIHAWLLAELTGGRS